MMKWGSVAALLLAAVLTACATPYQQASFGSGGGFENKELEPGIWRLTFRASPKTTYETVQTYWLYRGAELTLAQGYDGFEILSDVRFTGVPVRIAKGGGGVVFVPMIGPAPQPGTTIEGDIRLLKQPFSPEPPKRFDAAKLKKVLDLYVMGGKCDENNVCPHVHHYLIPGDTTN